MGSQCCNGRNKAPAKKNIYETTEKVFLDTNRTLSTKNTLTFRNQDFESTQEATENENQKTVVELNGGNEMKRSGNCPYCNAEQVIASKFKHLECTNCMQIYMQDGCTRTLYKLPPGSSLFRSNSPKRS
mmetsp:Transcript_7393/g.7256  ORF Transcript_7393/g.7256 Transcript_7393/m.7256 type:complete len:129 (+) Transcript_7393:12-398(+)